MLPMQINLLPNQFVTNVLLLLFSSVCVLLMLFVVIVLCFCFVVVVCFFLLVFVVVVVVIVVFNFRKYIASKQGNQLAIEKRHTITTKKT